MATVLQPAEQGIVSYLRSVTRTSASTRVPHPLPAGGFIVVRRSGGAPRNLVQTDPTMLVEVWGAGSYENVRVDPWNLTKQVWEALARADEEGTLDAHGVDVMRVSLTEPAAYPDESTGTPRYTFIFTPTLNTNRGDLA